MALAILNFARWLAWQLGDVDEVEPARPASITVYTSAASRTGELPAAS